MTAPPSATTASTLDELFLHSPSLERSLAALRRAAVADAPVLLLGEPGSGRSSLARAIHGSSPRRSGPLIEVDPATIPVSLFESELFGYRAGAFTGAEGAGVGRVVRANGGSLLLDNVESLPLSVQPKLLRLLAEKRYRPLGGEEEEADVRFLAIAGEELPDRAQRGVFRSDLYYRLEVLAFRVPPLRERIDDLPDLTRYLVRELSERLGRPELPLGDAAWRWMRDHRWPGNLRELRNVLERALIQAHGDQLEPPPPPSAVGYRPRPLAVVEEEEIRKALAFTRGHQGKAAGLLGISRKSLWEKRKRYGIP